MKNSAFKKWVGFAVVVFWGIAVALAFWWFEYRNWRNFADKTVMFTSEPLGHLYQSLPNAVGRPLIVHFVRPDCPCNRYQDSHIQELQPVINNIPQLYLKVDDPVVAGLDIPAAPSVAVWNEKGDIAYYGPYSSGAICGTGKDFVSMVVNAISHNQNPALINMVGVGCYCAWHEV